MCKTDVKKLPDVYLDDLPGDGTTGAHERVGLMWI